MDLAYGRTLGIGFVVWYQFGHGPYAACETAVHISVATELKTLRRNYVTYGICARTVAPTAVFLHTSWASSDPGASEKSLIHMGLAS